MANNIKGITVEIGGNTGPLNSALKGVNKTADSLQGQLKEVNRQLKFDPQNTVLLKQKQELLTKEISNTSTKLTTLKEAEKQAQEQFAQGKITQEQYQALQREVIKTESQLRELGRQAGLTNAALNQISTTSADVAEGAEKMAAATKGASTAAIGVLSGAAAAAGKIVSAFADNEQLVGGVETLFKDAAGTVSEYANQAYKTAGLSANEYMETVTGFSASLIQSLGGDTAKAARYADMAITDMSDNANKMGTDMGNIQNAYQGFAKQNYTMLDNLKLGYGGTEAEMQRLLDDAGKLAGVKFNISSYSDVVDAIHVMQTNMGIAGTTAKEAEETISGSIDMAKSSVTNLMSGLGQSGADIDKLTQDVVDAVKVAVQNIIPVLKNLMDNLPSGVKVGLGVTAAIAAVTPVLLIVSKIARGISAVTGALTMAKTATIAQTAAQFGWNAALLASPITWIVVGIAALVAGVVLLYKNCKPFHDWVLKALKSVESVAKSVFNGLITFFSSTIPKAWNSLVTFFRGIPEWWNNLWTQVGQIFDNIWNEIKNGISAAWNGIKTVMLAIISPLVNGVLNLWNGMKSGIKKIFDGIKDIAQGAWKIIKNVVLAPVLLICDLVTGNFGKLKSDLLGIWNNIKSGAEQIWNGLKNYFFGMLEAIKGFFTTEWNGIKAAAEAVWNGIVSAAKTIWNGLASFFTGLWKRVSEGITSAWSGIKTFFTNTWDDIKSIIKNAWNGIVSFLSNPEAILNAVKTAFNNAISWIKNLGTEAVQWGKDIINGIVNGINAAASAVGNAVKGVAQSIRSFLHFSKPDEGPLADFDTYMPDMMSLLAAGIKNNISKVSSAAKEVATAMTATIPTTFDSSVQVRAAFATAYGGYAPASGRRVEVPVNESAPAGTGNITVNQYYQGKVPSPAESARQSRNGLQQVVKKLRR